MYNLQFKFKHKKMTKERDLNARLNLSRYLGSFSASGLEKDKGLDSGTAFESALTWLTLLIVIKKGFNLDVESDR